MFIVFFSIKPFSCICYYFQIQTNKTMNTTRPCGCKGHRSCAVCEADFGIVGAKPVWLDNKDRIYYYDLGGDNLKIETLGLSGLQVIPEFISKEEEIALVKDMDALPWDKSQSGRRKQNYGPKTNFKKKKVKIGEFKGFPQTTKYIQDRFSTVDLLAGYRTVEQCSIEYTPETGSSIDPHIDDCWIWGERIVQLNLLSSTYLALKPYTGNHDRYNLKDVESYPATIHNGSVVHNPVVGKLFDKPYTFSRNYNQQEKTGAHTYIENNEKKDPENKVKNTDQSEFMVKIPLPPRSLLIMYGNSRYEWEHAVLRQDISDRRLIIAYRELTPPYLPSDEGVEILEQANKFW
ncbi:alpha-ketoglutarate-dependent dioxygenase alkB homolog 4 isoform X2 [Eurytemora carolleeae]|uniref:alpha-ketoglutarate-dependent dioxygenase alkB homolog 4 isoform X2 n=1 Tax=Eurytemora carolleeae TaxID=1294199 RepID=UPI000C792A99|nr:alpha-ketoglutarate-dependent dioxygenase alkB homolog 4 isoform X2 [Eurytemora carolleeae]|eukprot:XP_023344635.1 alpha-ketoglutarate-dependent dioxygenase alkB homolog 4-like isoform X2 [Eurytemora affinis]